MKESLHGTYWLVSLKDCIAVLIGMNPYPQEGVATGILFGNDTTDDNISPSLRVIKEAVVNYEIPYECINFDNSLESWAKQGILMLNSSLTCQVNNPGSHFNIWKVFMQKLIFNLSRYNNSLIYLLFGNQASSLKNNIYKYNKLIETYHPAFYARKGSKMPYNIFKDFNNAIYDLYGYKLIL